MSDDVLLQKLEDGVLLLTLNRPAKKNAFNRASWKSLTEALRNAQEDPDVACVVLAGAGGNFSSGMDLSDFGGGDDPEEEQPFYVAQRAVADFDKPMLAAAAGIAIGGGATLLFHCDVVYVGESLRMRLPFASLGLVPELASSYLLQAHIGARRAAELFYTAEWINAARALETGIATGVLPDAQLLDHTMAKAREIAQWPVRSLQETKRCLKVAHAAGIDAAIEIEKAAMLRMAGSPENIEAVTAFMQKREPDFKQFRKS